MPEQHTPRTVEEHLWTPMYIKVTSSCWCNHGVHDCSMRSLLCCNRSLASSPTPYFHEKMVRHCVCSETAHAVLNWPLAFRCCSVNVYNDPRSILRAVLGARERWVWIDGVILPIILSLPLSLLSVPSIIRSVHSAPTVWRPGLLLIIRSSIQLLIYPLIVWIRISRR